MTTHNDTTPDGDVSLGGIAELFALLNSEDEAIAHVETAVAGLRQVQAAKAALGRLPLNQVREALAQRQATLGGAGR